MSNTFELEGFEPIRRIGGGGFGDVWLARQTNVDRQVAIKVGHSAIQDETIRLRFDRECKALGRLSGHPNIVDVYTAGSLGDGRPYLVLEFIDGGTLWQRLKKSPIPENELRAIGTNMASALTEAHSSGVLHRDLKPENILIRSSGEAVLGDFGIARLHDGANTTSAAITASVAYAAPEILSGKRATIASDLYGIGICLLAAVFRSVPFVQKTDESIHPIINRVLTDKPPDVRRHGVSEELAAIIDSLLAKDPAHRPPSAAELLERFQQLGTVPEDPSPPADTSDSAATRVLAPATAATAAPADIAPAPAVPPSAPIGTPRMAPRAEDATPGLVPPNPQPPAGWEPGQSQPQTPLTSLPENAEPPPPLEQVAKEPSSNLKLFLLAYVATLILGGLAVWLISALFGGADPADSAEQTQFVSTIPAEGDGPQTDPASPTQGSSNSSEPLTIPLAAIDTALGESATTSSESPGPGAGTLCRNNPATDGLVDWTGRVIADGAGLNNVYQVVSRFATADQAAQYLDAYAGTNDCPSWQEPGETSEVVYSALQIAPPTFGDQARMFEITGVSDSTESFYGEIMLIQLGTDVFSLSLTTLSGTEVGDVNELATVAIERLQP